MSTGERVGRECGVEQERLGLVEAQAPDGHQRLDGHIMGRLVGQVAAQPPEGAVAIAPGLIDADPSSLWSIWPLMGRPHQAVFQAARPIGPIAGMGLRVDLVSGIEIYPHSTLGRFRLSVTDRPFPLFRPSLQAIRADTERDGLTRLGAAYALLGEWAPAAAVLARAAARPDAPTLDDFLLALARHHLGHRDEARSDCDRALQRLSTELAEDETRDVALEALMTIRGRGLGVDEAESLLLDAAFPADPFAP